MSRRKIINRHSDRNQVNKRRERPASAAPHSAAEEGAADAEEAGREQVLAEQRARARERNYLRYVLRAGLSGKDIWQMLYGQILGGNVLPCEAGPQQGLPERTFAPPTPWQPDAPHPPPPVVRCPLDQRARSGDSIDQIPCYEIQRRMQPEPMSTQRLDELLAERRKRALTEAEMRQILMHPIREFELHPCRLLTSLSMMHLFHLLGPAGRPPVQTLDIRDPPLTKLRYLVDSGRLTLADSIEMLLCGVYRIDDVDFLPCRDDPSRVRRPADLASIPATRQPCPLSQPVLHNDKRVPCPYTQSRINPGVMELVRRREKQQPEPPPPVDPVVSGRVLPCYELGMVLVQELFGQMQRLSEDREWEEADLVLLKQGIAQPAEPDSEWTN